MALNDSFWNNEQNRLLAILRPRLEQMAVEAAKQAAQKAGIAFNPNLANANAARWARDYTDTLLKQLGTTSTTGIGEIIAQWVEKPGATYGQLQQSLIQYGNVRAQAIAVTETTRAYAEGEEMAYKQEGITEWTWRTNRDEIVCRSCGPLNNKTIKIGDEFGKDKKGKSIRKPPAHVNCRCWVAPAVKPNKERDAVIKPANVAMAAEVMDIPRALGADVSKHFALQTERINELAQKNVEEMRIQIEKLSIPNQIPDEEHHFNKWGKRAGFETFEEYQSSFNEFVKKPDLRYLTGIRDDGVRVWYIVDLNSGFSSGYNETDGQHFTYMYHGTKGLQKFMDNARWLVEVNPKSFRVIK